MAMDKPRPHPFFIRNLDAGQLLETFLVSAVAAVLAVRFLLGLTGYPRLGGAGLHIAHMLWGGALMVAGVLVLLSYLGHRIRRAAAVLAGIGFGLFIDELGKFITSDNNYFYRPTIALIYVVFVLLFLWWRSLERHRVWNEETYLANALMLLQDAALHDLDPTEKYHLLRWLRRSGAAGTNLLGDIEEMVAARRPDIPARGAVGMRLRAIQKRIDSLLRSRWSGRIAIAFLLIRLLGAIAASLALVYSPTTTGPGETVDLPLLLASAVSGGLTLIGLVYLVLRSRVHALRWFKRSILASIFLTDLFTFYYQQLGAVADLAVDLVLLAVFEALLEVEHRRAGRGEATAG
ncbi:MAG: hypothetical protein E6J25_11655 [Chloroflexi bacterium]|nr:MAG: hypothetical protein E6J25_11655 [Chloroflexota bacterium]